MSSTTSLATTSALPVLREFLDEIFDELEEAGEDEEECLKLALQISEQKAIIDGLIRSKTQLEGDLAASIDRFHAWIAAHIRKDWASVSDVWKDWLTIRRPGRLPKRLANVPGSAKDNSEDRSGSSRTDQVLDDTNTRGPTDDTRVRDESNGFGTDANEGEATGVVRDESGGTTSSGGLPSFEGWSPEVRSVVEQVEQRTAGRTTALVGEVETETVEQGKRVMRRSSRKGKGKEMEETDEDRPQRGEQKGLGHETDESDEDEADEGAPSGSVDPDDEQTPRTTRSSRIRSKATVSDTEDEDEDAGEPPARTTRKRHASNPPEEPRKRLRKAVVDVPARSSSSHGSGPTAEQKDGKGIESQMEEWFTAESLERKKDEFRGELLGYLLKCQLAAHKVYSLPCDWCATTGITKCFGPTKTKTCFYCMRMKKSCSHKEKTGKGKIKEKKPAKEKKSDGRGKVQVQAAADKVGDDADVIEVDAEDDAAGPSQPPPTPRKVTLRVKKDPSATRQGSLSLPTGVTKTLDLDNKLGRRSAQIQTLEREISQWEIDSDLLLARIAAGKEMLAALRQKNGDVE